MYTNLPAARHALRLGLSAGLLTIGLPRLALSQDPPPLTKIRGVTVTATPLPGPNVMVGMVRDTAGFPIPGAEVTIPELKLRLLTNGEGVFRFAALEKGKYTMRARKVGFTPQVREFPLDTAGGVAEFALVPIDATLAPIIAWSDRPGITGTVGDTAFQPVAGAVVRLLGGGLETSTDSTGRFYLPAKGGSYLLHIVKPGYDYKLVSVTVPADSGRRVTAWLHDVTHLPTGFERNNVKDLRERVAWTKPLNRVVFTHDQLATFGSDWVTDAIASSGSRFGQTEGYSRGCAAIVDGGPGAANADHLTVDEVESVEIYSSEFTSPFSPTAPRAIKPTSITGRGGKSVGGVSSPTMPLTNTNRAVIQNGGRTCPLIYVWRR